MEYIISNKLGGQPVKYDDFDFSAKEQLEKLGLAAFGFTDHENKVIVLNGCVVEVDGSDLTMTAGYVFFKGEYYEVDAVNIEANVGEEAVWQLVESYDTRGNKRFKDDTVQDTYLVRKYTVVYKPSGSLSPLDKLLDSDTVYFSSYLGCPIGSIILWVGSEASVPDGYTICDGRSENGFTTPNLKYTFARGGDSLEVGDMSSGGTNAPQNGGSNTFTLDVYNLPSHTHSSGSLVTGTLPISLTVDYELTSYDEKSGTNRNFYGFGSGFTDGESAAGINQVGHNHVISGNTGSVGSGVSKSHIPAFTYVLYIMRTR